MEKDANKRGTRASPKKVFLRPKFMQMAIDAALKGMEKGGGPFGACIVDFDGKAVSCASNSVIRTPSPTRHAEVCAIDLACKKLKTHILDRHIIYTTTEPCLMCRGAIYWARLPIVVYGANQEDARKAGFDELNLTDAQFIRLGKRKTVMVRGYMRKDALLTFAAFRKISGKLY